MARVGVLGGSFNPVHFGHLHIAALAQEAASLDRVLFVPAKTPPHKNGDGLVSQEHRLLMLRAALPDGNDWEVDTVELEERASAFTVDTLDTLAAAAPGDTHVFIMGWDSLRDFPNWRDPEGILSRHRVVAVDRPGVPDTVNHAFAARVQQVRGNPLGITATEVRERLARDLSVRYLVPRPVLEYIQNAGLYRHP